MVNYRANLMICGGTGCIAMGGLNLKDALETQGKSLFRTNLPTDLSTESGDTFSLACYGKSE